MVLAATLGVLLGLFSTAGDAIHLKLINGVANSTAPWIMLAFAAGALQDARRAAMAAGMVALLCGVATYYVGFVLSGYGLLLPFWMGWSVAAIGGGGIYGYAGNAWRHGPERWRVLAVALLGGCLLAESASRLIGLEFWTGVSLDSTYLQVAIADALGAIGAVVLLLDRATWSSAARAVVPIAIGGLVLFLASERLLRWVGALGSS
jgi:Family of unknown function (DUF6518)